VKEQLPLRERLAPQKLEDACAARRDYCKVHSTVIAMPVMLDSAELLDSLAAAVQSMVTPAVSEAVSTAMPSLRTLGQLALGGAQMVLAQGAVNPFQSCSNPQLSCHNTTVVENLCCFNAPGGQLLQTQFWDTHPVTGPVDSWTLHGLW
jgi:ribonuclease T2